ncbi:MAG: hypothetical protein V5B44_13125 [Candidatus Accumulibacter necessarius]
MRDVEGRVAVLYLDAGGLERHARRLVFSASPLRRAGFNMTRTLHAAPLRIDDRGEQTRVGEKENLDPQRLLRRGDGIDEAAGRRIVRQDNQGTVHASWKLLVVGWREFSPARRSATQAGPGHR